MAKELVFVNDSAIDGVRGGKPKKPIGLVPFMFGVAAVPDLPGTVLKRLLTDVGMTPAGAHALIARLRTDGLLDATRRGRGADYRLSGALAAGFARVQALRTATAPEWSGGFHALLYQVPEAHRGFRDMLRRAAQVNGYGPLQQGVLIALHDRSGGFAHALAEAPAAARVHTARLEMDAAQARQAAYEAWGLAELEQRYRGHVRTLRAAVRGRRTEPSADATALRRYTELLGDPLIDTLGDPNLPAELLPPRWPRAELSTAIGAAHQRFWPAANAYVRELLADQH